MSKMNPYQKLLAHPLEVWQYYLDHKDRLDEGFQHLVAQVDDKTVYITTDGGAVVLNVYADGGDDITDVFEASDEPSLLAQYNKALRTIGYTVTDFEEPDDDPSVEYDDMIPVEDDEYDLYAEEISASEGWMNGLCTDLIYDFMDEDDMVPTEVIEECAVAVKEIVCKIMANFNIPVNRPMVLVGKDGSRFYTEHPYQITDEQT